MNTPLDENALDFLDDDAKRLVKEMLQAVVEHPDIYPNGFMVTRRTARDGSFEYLLATQGGPGPFRNHQRLTTNITDQLLYHGIAGEKRNPQWVDDFHSFTDATLEWQRIYGAITPDEIRRKIGQMIRHERPGRIIRFDVNEVAEMFGTTPERVSEQLRILAGAGLVDQRPMGDNRLGLLGLSSPAGLLWAERGYPSIHSLNSPTINVAVDLHLEIHNTIEQARATDVPDALIREFEAVLRRAKSSKNRKDRGDSSALGN